jgi:hypothetical protein
MTFTTRRRIDRAGGRDNVHSRGDSDTNLSGAQHVDVPVDTQPYRHAELRRRDGSDEAEGRRSRLLAAEAAADALRLDNDAVALHAQRLRHARLHEVEALRGITKRGIRKRH